MRFGTWILATGISMVAPVVNAGDSTFSDVWSTVEQGPYTELPQYLTTYDSLFDGNVDLISLAVNRTLASDADTLPWFQKLVHPIGICFAGTWTITAENPYTGYFASGTRGLIIVRASEALGLGEAGDFRAFGLAGKIFQATDPSDQTPRATANFFTIDDLGGTLATSFLDRAKSNAPDASFHVSQLAIFPTITKIAKTFKRADANPGVRQVYQIAELGLADPSTARSPQFMALVSDNAERVDAVDFRDELLVANYAQGLDFGIYVADSDDWQRIGQIHLDQQALSDGCDHRLHFGHPRWK